jgi:O-antigen/teichoic acid export membrane protein
MSGIGYTAFTIVVGFLATPVLLRHLGPDRFGAARAIADWVGYLTLADFGISGALGLMVLRAYGAGRVDQVASIVRGGAALLGRIALLVLPVGVALVWLMPSLVQAPPEVSRELRPAALVALAGLLFYPAGLFRGVLEATQRGFLVSTALIAQSMVVTALAIALSMSGWGLLGQSVATVAGTAVFAVLIVAVALRRMPGFAAQGAAPLERGALWRQGWPLAATSLANRLNQMTDSIVVGYLLGAHAVGVLFLTQRFVSLTGSQVNTLVNASWPALAELRSHGQHAQFGRRVAELVRMVVGCGMVLTGLVAAYNHHLVRLWVGEAMYGGDLLTAATAAASVTFGFVLLFSWIIDTQGDARARLGMSAVGSALNLGLSVVLIRWMGLPGVLVATAVAYAATDGWYTPYLVSRRYGVSLRAVGASALRGILCGAPWAAAVWWLARTHTPLGWLELGLEMGALGVLALAYCWYAVLGPPERAEWKKRMARRRR